MAWQEGWIGVDFDGTLSEYTTWQGPAHCGAPIVPMVERVKAWLAAGKKVKVFTARVTEDGTTGRCADAVTARRAIQAWGREHIGQTLEVTNVKDFAMVELWDDRAGQVRMNTGEPVGYRTRGH